MAARSGPPSQGVQRRYSRIGAASASSTPGLPTGFIAVAICGGWAGWVSTEGQDAAQWSPHRRRLLGGPGGGFYLIPLPLFLGVVAIDMGVSTGRWPRLSGVTAPRSISLPFSADKAHMHTERVKWGQRDPVLSPDGVHRRRAPQPHLFSRVSSHGATLSLRSWRQRDCGSRLRAPRGGTAAGLWGPEGTLEVCSASATTSVRWQFCHSRIRVSSPTYDTRAFWMKHGRIGCPLGKPQAPLRY